MKDGLSGLEMATRKLTMFIILWVNPFLIYDEDG